MKAQAFLNADEVIVKVSDGTWHRMPPKTSKVWVADFLYYIAGHGENVSNMKDGELIDIAGVVYFKNAIRSYETHPHRPVIVPSPYPTGRL